MSRQYTARNLVISFVIFASLACAIPGLQPAVAVPPTTMPLEVIIANTASAAQTQTQQAAPAVAVLPTDTPISIDTPIPSAIPAPVFSPYNSALVEQSDGSVLFIDKTGSFQLTFPSNWLPVRINHDEYYSLSVNEAVTTYPFLQTELRIIEDHDPYATRVHAFDIAVGRSQDQYVPHISVHWIGEELPLLEGASSHLEYMRSQNPELKVVTSPTEITTKNGIPAAIVEFTVPALSLATSLEIFPYERRVYFHSNGGTIYIIFTGLSDVQELVVPEFDQIVDSIAFFVP